MKQTTKLIIIAIAFAVILVAGIFGYKYLSENYQEQELTTQYQDNNGSTTEERETNSSLMKASDFTVLDNSGNEVKLSDNYGKPIVVNFWATWCGPCKSELPAFDSIYKEYDNEITVMMVNLTDGYQETTEGVKEFVNENGYTFPVYYDTQLSASRAYGISSVPMTLFINENGEIENYQIGAMSEDTLKNYIENLL